MALIESARGGDRLATLRDLRDILAESIIACEAVRDVAPLTNRLQSVLAEIAELEKPRGSESQEGPSVDDLAARRRSRTGGSAPTR